MSVHAAETGVRRLEAGGGKDVVLVAEGARLAEPSAVTLPARPEAEGGAGGGLIRPDGSINWGCPCLGGMAAGPCGDQFREAFSCFHYSEAEPKGSECYEKFSVMQECMAQFPELYGKGEEGEDEGEARGAREEGEAAAMAPEQRH